MQVVKGKQKGAQRVVIYGPEGIGKSSLAATFPSPLFLDVERGTSHLDVDRVEIPSIPTFKGALIEIMRGEHSYATAVIDTADWLEKLLTEDLCREFEKDSIEDWGWGKGWNRLTERFAGVLSTLEVLSRLGVNVVILAHSIVKKVEMPETDGGYDRYELKCSKRVTPLLKEWADAILFLNYQVIIEESESGKRKARGGKKRRIMTERSAAWDAKNRWGLDPVIDMPAQHAPLPAEIMDNLSTSMRRKPSKPAENLVLEQESLPERPEATPREIFAKKAQFYAQQVGVDEIELLEYLRESNVSRWSKKLEDKLNNNIEGVKKTLASRRENA